MNSKILVVDDELNILDLIKFHLELNDYQVITASTGHDAVKMIKEQEDIDLVILDLMLPGIDGLEVCQYIRKYEPMKDIPIIMLTAKGTEEDKIYGLELGADDYVTKPFSPKELSARVKALLRRTEPKNEAQEVIKIQKMMIHVIEHTVTIEEVQLALTLKEYEVLKLLAANRGKVYTRDQLLNAVWGYDYFGETRTVDVHIRHIRKKISSYDPEYEYIETVRGVGYKIK